MQQSLWDATLPIPRITQQQISQPSITYSKYGARLQGCEPGYSAIRGHRYRGYFTKPWVPVCVEVVRGRDYVFVLFKTRIDRSNFNKMSSWLGALGLASGFVLRNLLSQQSNPNKVLDVKSDQYSDRFVQCREEALVLYGPGKEQKSTKEKYEIVLQRPCTETLHQAFRLV